MTAAQAKVDEANTRLAKAQDELKPLKQAQEAAQKAYDEAKGQYDDLGGGELTAQLEAAQAAYDKAKAAAAANNTAAGDAKK